MKNFISIQGAREHNLKNVSVDIPKDSLVVITGLSGSGKSSLAFDTIYAEGQRRYVESLSAYARQFLQLMQKPDVDSIEGLSPAISIEQKTTSKNPRSTVGTITEIYDYLRVLFARVGIPYSPATGLAIESQTISQMVDRILSLEEGTKCYLLAPLARGRKGEYKSELQQLKKQGFLRVKVDGTLYEIDDIPPLAKNIKHTLSVVVDRLVLKPGLEQRLAESLETALKMADGLAICEILDTKEEILLSEKFACPVSGFTIAEIEPRLFSFNSPFGACPKCDGLGVQTVFDESLVVPHPEKSILQGTIAPWFGNAFQEYYMQALLAVAQSFGEQGDIPFDRLSAETRKTILYGSGREKISFTYQENGRSYKVSKPFEGVIPNLQRRFLETESERSRDWLETFQNKLPCPVCEGYRLKPEALMVKIKGLHIGQICAFSIDDAVAWFQGLLEKLSPQQQTISHRLLKEIESRLRFLKSVGLGYLTLSRTAGTLSGGESQRIRLASQIGSGLTGVLYVLDEPSIGLHQRDNQRLLETLQHLKNLGNSVIVVEHDEDAIRQADYVIDMGPGAGRHGGMIVAQGTPAEILANPESITGQYLSGIKSIETPAAPRPGNGKALTITGVTTNNLKKVDLSVPLGCFVAVTGVSGGGKSSLVIETLFPVLNHKLLGASSHPLTYDTVGGVEYIDKVIDIDQSPIGRTPRSNPATYTGAFTPIREWFAALPESKARGYGPGRFSFNVKGGRCEACHGDGVLKIEMHFLPDVYVTCDQCKGRRYNRETLEILFKGKSIAEVLEMTVDDAAVLFEACPAVYKKLLTLQKVGLGYIHVGQQATTLSGGEAQRVKLSKELARSATGKTLYILDEPTTGLHFEDIKKLLSVLHTLVDQGNTVLVIEHNLDVIKTADWIVDVGPEGGTGGGRIVAQGTPRDIAENPESHTGVFLKKMLYS